MAQIHAGSDEIVHKQWVKVKLATVALDNARGSIGRVFQLAASDDRSTVQKAKERLDANIKGFTEAIEKIDPLVSSEEEKIFCPKPRKLVRTMSP